MTMPALFVAHGSPMLALENNEYTDFLESLSSKLPVPKGIVIFSAHWDSPEQYMTMDEAHETMHDFYGFPEEMYQLRYQASGSSELNQRVAELFDEGNLKCQPSIGRGLDHGVWVILQKMYPEANIPVVELSVDSRRSPAEQYAIGSMLKELREEDILVIGSGGLVHNLRMLSQTEEADEWALAFDEWIAKQLEEWNTRELFLYDKRAPHAIEAVPPYGIEHFIPLFYAMGAADDERKAKRLFQDYQYGNLSLNCWMFGGF